MFFLLPEPGAQTIDITNITTPTYAVTLLGGQIRDIVIADDDSINGMMTLTYDAPYDPNSVEDTLKVIGSARVTAADLRNVTGLEWIQLYSGANSGQRWDIDLTDRVINQTTGTAPLTIWVDPEVPADSKLYIYIDSSASTAANNDVIIRAQQQRCRLHQQRARDRAGIQLDRSGHGHRQRQLRRLRRQHATLHDEHRQPDRDRGRRRVLGRFGRPDPGFRLRVGEGRRRGRGLGHCAL